ncbi:MAG: Lrp/AsnC family transcriptional regulator of ectoine degradation [Congregibacter sp.]|jgi:Lrp/AsnC family transcriptional regulator of ectoine degradation
MKKMALDATDIRILCVVQKQGHLSKSRLAELVHLSPTPCWERLNKLKTAGLIRGYYANIALNLIADVTKVVVTITLSSHRNSDFDRFESHICKLDQVIDCIATGGGTDYIMKVVTSNLTEFQNIMENLLAAELGIERYMTYIVTREIKSSQPNLKLLANKQDF